MSTVTWNGEEYDEGTFAEATRLALNSVQAGTRTGIRTDYLGSLGRQYDGDRDIYDVLGYPEEIRITDYRAKYERNIGKRIVELPAEDSWTEAPRVTDSPESDESTFEREFERFRQAVKPWHYLRRTDTIAGIGQYAVLFIGFTDDGSTGEAIDVSSLPTDVTKAVSHFEPFAQDSIEGWELGKNEGLPTSHPRYNKPVEYHLNFGDSGDRDLEPVHWSRVLHVPSDGRDESDLIGTPRLKDVYNRLIDLEKTVGSSAEIFWTGASPRYQFNVDADNASDVPQDELTKLDEEVQKLVHNMQNYIKTFNTDVEVISGEEVDPSGVHDVILSAISGTKGIPKRILTGSERGELASTQDRATWFGKVETRRNQFVEPAIVRPFIDRLIEFEVLSEPMDGVYTVEWPNLFELNELEQSEVEANRAEVIAQIAPKGNTDLLGSFNEIMSYVKTGEKPDFGGSTEPSLDEADSEVQRQFNESFGDET
jgi:hypothetical protein